MHALTGPDTSMPEERPLRRATARVSAGAELQRRSVSRRSCQTSNVPGPDRCSETDPSPSVLKLMLDTNVIDELVADSELVSILRHSVESGRAEILITHLQIDEVMNTGDNKRAKREALVQLLAELPAVRVPTYGSVLDLSRLDNAMLASDEHAHMFLELTGGNLRHYEDALIVLTAAWFYADVVSENVKDVPKMAGRAGVRAHRSGDLRRLLSAS